MGIGLDPTYSKGNFYNRSGIPKPSIYSDLFPQVDGCIKADACNLDFIQDASVESIMFDPPFVAGHTSEKPTGIIGERFHGFRYVKDLWEWYDRCIVEFSRVLKKKGVLIFKCQDTVSSGKQWLSHVHIINECEKAGFYALDMFILTAENRIIGHNHANQKHARKHHSYFLVFRKEKNTYLTNGDADGKPRHT